VLGGGLDEQSPLKQRVRRRLDTHDDPWSPAGRMPSSFDRCTTTRAALLLSFTLGGGAALTSCHDQPAADTDTTGEVPPVGAGVDALPNVFIQPYRDCRAPVEGDTTDAADGQVCTNVFIGGCTEPGKRFQDYGSCDVVRTQRPFWQKDPSGTTSADDPRLKDEAFMAELGWVTEEAAACGCVCCHSSGALPETAVWDIDSDGIWTDALTDRGVAMFTGELSSEILGAYPPDENHGFDRDTSILPTTDVGRMVAFFQAELDRRGVTDDDIAGMTPFGAGILEQASKAPEACVKGEGVDAEGLVHWTGGDARYVYVLREGSATPTIPPNLDTPEGTLWRLDMKPSSEPVATGITYGSTPAGSVQKVPSQGAPPTLTSGETYHLVALRDVLFARTSCLFVAP
jgi:hypothetical protein